MMQKSLFRRGSDEAVLLSAMDPALLPLLERLSDAGVRARRGTLQVGRNAAGHGDLDCEL